MEDHKICECSRCGQKPKIIYGYPPEGAGFAWPEPLVWFECQNCKFSGQPHDNYFDAQESWENKNTDNEILKNAAEAVQCHI